MADLDDFFAKKDKKKGKTKKFLSSEELMKQLEQTAIKESEPSKKPAKIEEESETTKNEIDEEWKEYEEEKRPDLSNLKLGQLNINDSNENQHYSGGNDNDNESSNNDGDSAENPWNKANSTQGGAKPDKPTLPDPAKQTKATGAYVPPSLLRAENAAKSRLNRKNAPDLKNEESFPELGTAKAPEPIRSNKKDGFEEVKHGWGKSLSSLTAGPGSVSLGNAFSTLDNEDS